MFLKQQQWPEMGPDANMVDYPQTSAPVHYLSGVNLGLSLLPYNLCLLFFFFESLVTTSLFITQKYPQYKELFISVPVDWGLSLTALL